MAHLNGIKDVGVGDLILLVKCLPTMHKSLGSVSGPEQIQCGGAHLETQSMRGRGR